MFGFEGWGRTNQVRSRLVKASLDPLLPMGNPRGALPIGGLRSYGDSALNSNGVVISSGAWSDISRIGTTKVFRCGAGIPLSEVERFALGEGFFPYVVPGTQYVTVGGAIASDIHGKSHHKVGSISQYVRRIKLLTAFNEVLDVYPFGPTSALFWATCGGMGLTGLILEADIELREVNSNLVDIREFRAGNLREILELMETNDSEYEYSVAWIDLSGDFRGRGKVSFANHSMADEFQLSNHNESYKSKAVHSFKIPFIGWINFITPLSTRLFNEFWFRKPLLNGCQNIMKFMHPLDPINNWNRLYGKSGFVQYQFVVPTQSQGALQDILNVLRDGNVASPLGVLKKLGSESGALLGFAMPGWTLAIDVPARHKDLSKILNQIDEIVLAVGGRVYLTKDSRVSRLAFRRMYPKFHEFLEIKKRVDPDMFWISDQFRRLMQ